ncbi:MAG: Isoquinoline 1-oxidoreductase subunit [Burkholderiales bacterium]
MLAGRNHLVAWLLGCLPLVAFAQSKEEESIQAFMAAVKVMQHPRCTNCHANGDGPRQTDESREHIFNVKRGPNDRGVGGYTCKSCHQSANIVGIPGADDWPMPPRAMSWGESTPAEICATLTDKNRNGNRAPRGIALHVENDILVNWAWQPGEKRAIPPLTHAEFVKLIQRWSATGGFCPK